MGMVVTQKWLTGHPKGPASSWQLNGAVQAMLSGRVPGNRNLDNVDPELQSNKNLLYTSFGFGQAGGELLLVHPDYFLATLSETELSDYVVKRDARWKDSYKFHEDVVAGRRKYVEVKVAAPYETEDTKTWLLSKDRRLGAVEKVAGPAKHG